MNVTEISSTLTSLKQRPIVVASHPRSGTHLTIDLLRRQFRECESWKWYGEGLNCLYVNLDALYSGGVNMMCEEKAIRLLQRSLCPIVKTHFLFGSLMTGPETSTGCLGDYWLTWLNQRGVFVYVCRDGRDVMCSLHRWRWGFDPRSRVNISEFIRQRDGTGVSRVRSWANHVRQWRNKEGIHLVRFEDITKDTENTLCRLGKILELEPLCRRPLCPIRISTIWVSRINRMFSK